MIPVEVCHYTTKDIALNYILPEKRLRFGQLKCTNDPKESKIRTGSGRHKESEVLDPNLEGQCFVESLRVHDYEWKVICFTASRQKLGDTSPPKFKKDQNQCFNGWNESELSGYNHPRMWDQYAERHKGVCLVFDGIKLDQMVHEELAGTCQIFSGMVKYSDIKSTSGTLMDLDYSDVIAMGPTEAAREHFRKYYAHYFLKKNLDWERETEFRWLVHSTRNGPEYVSISGALIGIIIGMDYPRADFTILKSLCKELNVPAGRMGWASGLPIINYNFFKLGEDPGKLIKSGAQHIPAFHLFHFFFTQFFLYEHIQHYLEE